MKEPDWNILILYGLPMNIQHSTKPDFSYNAVIKNIVLASRFLADKKGDVAYQRNFDAFKALLLSLKIHYPTKFKQIEYKTGMELTGLFDLNNISGRDIKLRNICLYTIAEYHRVNEKKSLQ